MNVCILSKMFPPGVGGAETYAYELANALGERGHTVDVYTQYVGGKNNDISTHQNVTVKRICYARKKFVVFETIYYSLNARSGIDFSKYDVIHGTLMPASTIALTPGFGMADCPLIVTSHGTSIDEALSIAPTMFEDYLLKYVFHPLNILMDLIAGHVADGIIAISNHAANRLKHYFGDIPIFFIPHGVNTSFFTPNGTLHPSVSDTEFTLLYIGRLSPRKGLELLLWSLLELSEETKLLIGGTGRHRERLEDLTSNLGLEEQVEFLGFVPREELPSLYRSADVFVLPSTYEGFGLVVLEAMACGTPVVGTQVGGVPDIITDTVDGFLVDREPAQIAKRIDTLAKDKRKRERMQRNARNKAEKMNWESVAERVEDVYKRL